MTTTAKPQAQPVATPENTPIPGGGRWRWDADACAWAEVLEPSAAPLEPITATEPTPE